MNLPDFTDMRSIARLAGLGPLDPALTEPPFMNEPHLSPDEPTQVQQARQRLIAAALEYAELVDKLQPTTPEWRQTELGEMKLKQLACSLYIATKAHPERSPRVPAADPRQSSGFPGPLDE